MMRSSDPGIAPPPLPLEGGTTSLPLGDFNVIVLTDVHSWVAGHAHDPHLDADYGHVLSFHSRLRSICDALGRDVHFVMNGDFMDGTGLSRDPPMDLLGVLRKMPWDAVNVGNHDVEYDNTTRFITREGGFVDEWEGRYLTSNVVMSPPPGGEGGSMARPMGSRFRFLKGRNTANTVLAFGFLYDFDGASPSVTVERVEDAVKSRWFLDVISGTGGRFDAILVLAHMDVTDPLVSVVLSAIRAVCGPDMPVQFVTGHTHYRGQAILDETSTSFEAGRFLDTVGFVSFPTLDSVRCRRSEDGRTATDLFRSVFLDANVGVLSGALGLARKDDLNTQEGIDLSKYIFNVRESMGLLDVIGCADQTYYLNQPISEPDSLWGLWVHDVLPNQLFERNKSKIFIQHVPWAFRDGIYEGQVTVDDIYLASPFDDKIYTIAEHISGDVLLNLTAFINTSTRGTHISGALPLYAIAGEIHTGSMYDLYSVEYGSDTLSKALMEVMKKGEMPPPKQFWQDGRELTIISIWRDFIIENWSCETAWIKNQEEGRLRILTVAALVPVITTLFLYNIIQRARKSYLKVTTKTTIFQPVQSTGNLV